MIIIKFIGRIFRLVVLLLCVLAFINYLISTSIPDIQISFNLENMILELSTEIKLMLLFFILLFLGLLILNIKI